MCFPLTSPLEFTPAVIAGMQAHVALSNFVFAQSLMEPRLRLVYVTYSPTAESTNMTDNLYDLENPYDGRFDELSTLRNKVGADLTASCLGQQAPATLTLR